MVSETVRFLVALGFSGVIHLVAVVSLPYNVLRLHSIPLTVTISPAAIGGLSRPSGPPSKFTSSKHRDDISPGTQIVQTNTLTKPLVLPAQLAPPETFSAVALAPKSEMRIDNTASVLQQGEAGDHSSKQLTFSTPSQKYKDDSMELLPMLGVPSYSPPPEYPEEARWEKRTGRVLLAFRLRQDGIAEDVRLMASSGHADLDAAARESLERWRFEVPIGATKKSVWYRYAFRFELM